MVSEHSEQLKAILRLNWQPGIVIESSPAVPGAAPSGRNPLPPAKAKPMPRLPRTLDCPPVRWGLNE